ncbi:uncharacterized protein V6R79_006844 [Siganus canaliculatus]
MEGEKERQWQQREEKESNEAEDDGRSDDNENEQEEDESLEEAALLWQESSDTDNLNLPIMHWEALSLHIAELEKKEEEKKQRIKGFQSGTCIARGQAPVTLTKEGGRRLESLDDGDDACNSHVLALTSRLQTQMNLQLCFINNSESEEEEETKKESSNKQKGTAQVHRSEPPARTEKTKSRGLRNTLRNLRDRLRTDHKTVTAARNDPIDQRRHWEHTDLLTFSIKDLRALSTSLSKAIQDLNTDLVGGLQIRDQLRTEQDAMLLEVQDLTCL